jgi:orotate phosphoribosyltransferase
VLLQPDEPFTFASGLRSPVYCDNRLLLGDVAARRAVTAAFAARCAGAEVIAGPATGGIPWAAWAAEELGLPMLEDTISTGESALNAAVALRESGAEVLRCICIFTWGWHATAQAFAAVELSLEPLAMLPELLEVATASGRLSPAQRTIVEDWVADPRAWSESVKRDA